MAGVYSDAQRRADDSYESVRAMNHGMSGSLPAPLAYDLIGSLKAMSNQLPQLFDQIAVSLSLSLSEFEMYEDDGGDPLMTVARANERLRRAAELASELGDELKAAQTEISGQGYRKAKPSAE